MERISRVLSNDANVTFYERSIAKKSSIIGTLKEQRAEGGKKNKSAFAIETTLLEPRCACILVMEELAPA